MMLKSKRNPSNFASLSNAEPTLISILILGLLTYLHSTALYIFSRGFLLSRLSLPDQSNSCHYNQFQSSLDLPINNSFINPCHFQPTHSKLIFILIDALRYDFLLPHSSNYSFDPLNQNQLTLPSKLTLTQPNHSTLFHFMADPPTTTLQRLKGLTTGTLPTFIDFGSNFASSNLQIDEDSWLSQLHRAGKKIGFVGDDTWLKLFGTDDSDTSLNGLFHPNITFGFESFNVEDLDTVDEGVENKFFDILGIHSDQNPTTNSSVYRQDWDVLIGHFLGLDHAGHRFGASHPKVQSKLHQYNRFLQKIVSNLDDETLLVLIGDHGMDSKGDHGGDSFSEVSTALWIYSKTHSLLNQHQPIPSWAFDSSSFLKLQPSLGEVRTVSQIDLVPTLSLMLGTPIPFSNLGMIIPEFFFRPTTLQHLLNNFELNKNLSAIETLSISMSINSDQLWKFLDRYTGGSNHSTGQDLAQHLSELRRLYNQATELFNLEHHDQAYRAHRNFSNSLLSTCRKIWAKFIPSLMIMGIFIMSLSFLVSCKLISCIKWTTHGPHAPIRTSLHAGVLFGLLGLGLGLLSHLTHFTSDVGLFSNLLVGSSLGICTGILTHQPRKDLDTSFGFPTFRTLCKLFPVILHGIALGSNSYTVWEDRVVLHLISFSILLPISMGSFHAPQKRLRNRLLGFSLLFGICIRLISLSTVCREEQGGNCLVTFYSSSTSSNAPNWVMSILLLLALALPIVPAWFLGFSDSYRGPASFYFGSIWRIILLCGVQYWITDYILSHEGLNLSSDLIETGNWIKLLVGRFDIILCLFAGGILWFILPLCIDLKRDQVENETKDGEKPRLLVYGFANAYGSSYLMFLTAAFGILFLVNQPVGQVVLSIGLIAILLLIELNDSLQDTSKLKDSFSKAIASAAQPKSIQQEKTKEIQEQDRKIDETDWGIIVGLNLLGYLIFFGTGHQATFSSIQWKTGFIGLKSAHQIFSCLLITLNTLSGFILVGISLPLLKIWNLSPIINLKKDQDHEKNKNLIENDSKRSPLESEIIEIKLKFINLNVFLNLINLLFIFYLRRHLMVWKIFCPRVLLSGLVVLTSDVVFLFITSFALVLVKFKILRSFGNQYFV